MYADSAEVQQVKLVGGSPVKQPRVVVLPAEPLQVTASPTVIVRNGASRSPGGRDRRLLQAAGKV